MKRTLFIFAFALCCLAPPARAQEPPPPAAQNGGAAPAADAPASPAPSVKIEPAKVISDELFRRGLKDVGGRDFRLADYRGRVFVINLWATWCGPCRLEIPGFNKIYDDYSARGVEFIGLTTEDPEHDAGKVGLFAREMKMKYKLGWLDAETAKALMGTRIVLPQTFVVGADGRVVLHIRGYNPRVPDMVRYAVGRALEPQPAAAPPAPAADAPAPAAPGTAAPRP